MIKTSFHAMGCRILVLVDSPYPQATEMIHQVPSWFEYWEQLFSRFRGDSELSKINCSQGKRLQVSDYMSDVLHCALTARSESGGLITPNILNNIEAVGYSDSFELLHKDQSIPLENISAPHENSFQTINLDLSNNTVFIPEGIRLDLGGIAKGWAADQVMRHLSEVGSALVDAGGDIAISSPMQNGSSWQVGIADPFHPTQNLEILELSSGGVATSGKDYRFWSQSGIPRHHIIDPRTGLPAVTDICSCSVIAPTVMKAEMAAKTVFILGSKPGMAWLEDHPSYAAYLVLDNGETIASKEMAQFIRRT